MRYTNEKVHRTSPGVLATLSEVKPGTLCLFLDDLAELPSIGAQSWATAQPFTAREFPKDRLESMSLSSEEFAQIGEAIVARLLALTSH